MCFSFIIGPMLVCLFFNSVSCLIVKYKITASYIINMFKFYENESSVKNLQKIFTVNIMVHLKDGRTNELVTGFNEVVP